MAAYFSGWLRLPMIGGKRRIAQTPIHPLCPVRYAGVWICPSHPIATVYPSLIAPLLHCCFRERTVSAPALLAQSYAANFRFGSSNSRLRSSRSATARVRPLRVASIGTAIGLASPISFARRLLDACARHSRTNAHRIPESYSRRPIPRLFDLPFNALWHALDIATRSSQSRCGRSISSSRQLLRASIRIGRASRILCGNPLRTRFAQYHRAALETNVIATGCLIFIGNPGAFRHHLAP